MQEIDNFEVNLKKQMEMSQKRREANRIYVRKWQIASAVMLALTTMLYFIDWIMK